jgi:hypothetical protein
MGTLTGETQVAGRFHRGSESSFLQTVVYLLIVHSLYNGSV